MNRLSVDLFELLSNLVLDALCKLSHWHGSLLATTLLTHAHELVGSLFLAYDDHVRHTFELVVADFTADLLVAVVDVSAHVLRIEVALDLLGVVVLLLRDRQDSHLIGRKPQREVPGSVLNEHSSEALE